MKFSCFVFLGLLLTACQSSLIADLVTPSGKALFHDDFSDPSSGWPRTNNPNGSLEYSDGAYRMLVQSANHDLWALSGHKYGDVQIEVDATRTAGSDNNHFGLICRFLDGDHFYIFLVSSDGYYVLGKVEHGTTFLLGQEMMAYSTFILQGDGRNHLRFDCIGNTLKGSVNGQVIAISSDTDFTGGDAGLITGTFNEGGVEVSFDNFVVYKP